LIAIKKIAQFQNLQKF